MVGAGVGVSVELGAGVGTVELGAGVGTVELGAMVGTVELGAGVGTIVEFGEAVGTVSFFCADANETAKTRAVATIRDLFIVFFRTGIYKQEGMERKEREMSSRSLSLSWWRQQHLSWRGSCFRICLIGPSQKLLQAILSFLESP